MNDTNTPLISVIVPVYNAELYLKQCINSVISQTYTHWELVLVDDGSTDNSGSICDSYSHSDARIRCIHKENEGLSSAREVGIKAIFGSYAMFVDSDDWIDEDTLERSLSIAQKYNAECVCFSYIREYPEASLPVHIYDGSKDFSQGNIAEFYRRFWGLYGEEMRHPERGDSVVSCCMKLYSSKLLKDGKFFDLKRIGGSEDTLFNIYALVNCRTAFYLDEPLYHYRKSKRESLSNAYRPLLQMQYNQLFGEFFKAADELEADKECIQSLYNRIVLTPIGVGLNELSNPNKREHIKRIRQYIVSDLYQSGYRESQKECLSFVWKLFVFCAGHGWAFPLYLLLLGINFLRSKV